VGSNNNFDKIIFFSNLFPNPTDRERGIFVYQLAKEINKTIPVDVVCPLPWFPSWQILKGCNNWFRLSKVPAKSKLNDITVYYPKYPIIPKISDRFHAASIFIFTSSLLKRLTQGKTLISAHWIYPDCVSAVLFGKTHKIPVTVTARGCDINRDFRRTFIRPQIAYAIKNADRVVTVSKALADTIHTNIKLGSRPYIIPNGINHNLFSPRDKLVSRRALGITSNIKCILYIGQLVPVKDHATFLKALSILIHNNKGIGVNIHAYLIGAGPLQEELEDLTDQLQVKQQVHFVGQQNYEDIPKWIGCSDVVCLTSMREGRPNALLEAIACGRPVVASRVGGIPEFVTKENGILFQKQNPFDLATAIDSALKKDWSSKKIQATVKDLTWTKAAHHYIHLFHDIMINTKGVSSICAGSQE
jgi:glycosyltransferase involved in cell wall biosynthesis